MPFRVGKAAGGECNVSFLSQPLYLSSPGKTLLFPGGSSMAVFGPSYATIMQKNSGKKFVGRRQPTSKDFLFHEWIVSDTFSAAKVRNMWCTRTKPPKFEVRIENYRLEVINSRSRNGARPFASQSPVCWGKVIRLKNAMKRLGAKTKSRRKHGVV